MELSATAAFGLRLLGAVRAILTFPFGRLRTWTLTAWRKFRQEDRFRSLELAVRRAADAGASENGDGRLFEMHGIWWGYSEGDGWNAPFCPVCLSNGAHTPLRRTEHREGEMMLECLAHGVPAPHWFLNEWDYSMARQHGRVAAQVVTAGVARIPGRAVRPMARSSRGRSLDGARK